MRLFRDAIVSVKLSLFKFPYKTLGVFEFDKPKNKELATKLIENHYEKIKHLKPLMKNGTNNNKNKSEYIIVYQK